MPSTTFTLDTIGAELERVGQRLGAAVQRGMYGAAERCRQRVVQAIDETKPHPPVDTGELKRSFKVVPVRGGAVLESGAPHAAHQEFGTRPFTPPFDPIYYWAQRKLRGARRARKKGRAREARQMARRVWRKIRREGITPKRFYARASRDFDRLTYVALQRELRRVTA